MSGKRNHNSRNRARCGGTRVFPNGRVCKGCPDCIHSKQTKHVPDMIRNNYIRETESEIEKFFETYTPKKHHG